MPDLTLNANIKQLLIESKMQSDHNEHPALPLSDGRWAVEPETLEQLLIRSKIAESYGELIIQVNKLVQYLKNEDAKTESDYNQVLIQDVMNLLQNKPRDPFSPARGT